MNISLINLLHEKTKTVGDHWLWQGTLVGEGYGQVRYEGNYYLIHRLAISIYHKIPYKGDWVSCHTCEYRNCWNPLHLYQGTQKANVQDSVIKGNNHNKVKTHCKYGHEFNLENTYIYNGGRYCLACKREAKKRYEIRESMNKKGRHVLVARTTN